MGQSAGVRKECWLSGAAKMSGTGQAKLGYLLMDDHVPALQQDIG
jgi:hypothetical protein